MSAAAKAAVVSREQELDEVLAERAMAESRATAQKDMAAQLVRTACCFACVSTLWAGCQTQYESARRRQRFHFARFATSTAPLL